MDWGVLSGVLACSAFRWFFIGMGICFEVGRLLVIDAVRPSRRPRCGLLRMTFFLNAIINLRHPEEARSAVSKDACSPMRCLLLAPRAPAARVGRVERSATRHSFRCCHGGLPPAFAGVTR